MYVKYCTDLVKQFLLRCLRGLKIKSCFSHTLSQTAQNSITAYTVVHDQSTPLSAHRSKQKYITHYARIQEVPETRFTAKRPEIVTAFVVFPRSPCKFPDSNFQTEHFRFHIQPTKSPSSLFTIYD